ncbi:hypothetical protein SK128_001303 [Halocaridina rubra]|uniref:Fructose-2,6-bisphosphatase TIGAR n=1 Tax=Halocaridina rubra TaxID=373956 RepID=A0AAN8WL14_HALRR
MRRSMAVVFRVVFVRHGETNANKEHRIQGHLDIPLSSRGEKQATLAGKSLSEHKFSRAYASDLQRAYATCERILEQNTCGPPTIKEDAKLRERNFGSVEGLHIDEVKSMATAEGLTWPQYNPPGAETLGVLQERMVCFFKELCQSVFDKNKQARIDIIQENQNEDLVSGEKLQQLEEKDAVERILVVSHGAALKQLYAHFHKTLECPLPGDTDILSRISPNTGISEYVVQYSPKKYYLRCVRIHDENHLQGLS